MPWSGPVAWLPSAIRTPSNRATIAASAPAALVGYLTKYKNRHILEPMAQSPLPIAQVKAELFRALAHPVRVRALELLVEQEWSVGELAAALEVDLPHLSQQLAVLRRANVVATRRDGNTIHYSVQNPGIAAL